jgi:hypothetical protein
MYEKESSHSSGNAGQTTSAGKATLLAVHAQAGVFLDGAGGNNEGAVHRRRGEHHRCGGDGGWVGRVYLSGSDEMNNMEYPDKCPITKRTFFMLLLAPWDDVVPTYGGPYDSYTIPEPDEDGNYTVHRYDHDLGGWVEPETIYKEQLDEPEFTITIEQLKANGWKIDEVGFPYHAEKRLGETEKPEDDIKLVIHTLRNKPEFALLCPDGTMVSIGPYTIDELNLFERMILYVEPPY